MSLKDWITRRIEVATAIPATENKRKLKSEGPATAIVAIPATDNLPEWCDASCGNFEELTLPRQGLTAGCIIRDPDMETWRRLDRMEACPVWH